MVQQVYLISTSYLHLDIGRKVRQEGSKCMEKRFLTLVPWCSTTPKGLPGVRGSEKEEKDSKIAQ